MSVVTMSQGELSRYDTLLRVERRELRSQDAATLLGISQRQVERLLLRLRADGAEGLISRKRGRPSNRRIGDAFRSMVLYLGYVEDTRKMYHAAVGNGIGAGFRGLGI